MQKMRNGPSWLGGHHIQSTEVQKVWLENKESIMGKVRTVKWDFVGN